MSAAGFTTNDSSQVLLVSVHNVIYPITEYVLHRVFDPYGCVEKIDILQSSQLLQAAVQFDSCQNAVWAKSQLQGRYIYDGCCQLDIQFYKSFGNDNQTRNFLTRNEFASDLDFIKDELRRMIVITDRMQERIKTMNCSIQKYADTVSKSSESKSSISVISPTKPKVCNDSLAVVSTTSEIHMKKDSVNIFENEQKFGRNLGFPEHVVEQLDSKKYLDLLLSDDNNIHNCKSKSMLKIIDLESAHILFDGMRELNVVPQPSHIVDVQVCGVLLPENHPFNFYKEEIEDVLHCTSMDRSSKYACKMLDNMCKHGVIVGYMKRDKSNSVLKIHWEVIRVFDPGGVYIASYNQGVYYLVASVKGNYGCVYTGTNALNEWDQHHKFFGLDGQNIHFLDIENENFPSVYYPSGLDKALAMQLTLDETLMTTQIVYFQVALLYTSSSSERQIRVHTAAAHVVTDLGEMYHETDTGAIISLLSRLAIENTLSHKLEDAHMLIQLKVVKSLTEYRNLHVVQHRLGGLMLFPESLKYLALYALSLSMTVALHDGFNDTYIGYFATKIEYVDIMKNLNEFVYDSISRVKWKDNDYTVYAKDLIKCKLVVHANAKKVLIFDPGSYIRSKRNDARYFDLEDKVILRAGGNDTTLTFRGPPSNMHKPETAPAKPRRHYKALAI